MCLQDGRSEGFTSHVTPSHVCWASEGLSHLATELGLYLMKREPWKSGSQLGKALGSWKLKMGEGAGFVSFKQGERGESLKLPGELGIRQELVLADG